MRPTLGQRKSAEEGDEWFAHTWGRYGKCDGEFDYPTGIAVNSDRQIYVVDKKNHRVQCFTSDGKFICKWGKEGRENGEFNHPHGVCIYKNMRQAVLEAVKVVPEFSLFPPGVLPECIAYMGEHVYITDVLNCRVQAFDCDGTFVRRWGNQGLEDGQFNMPEGCDMDEHGFVYVADSFNHRIQTFTYDGKFIRKWGTRGRWNGQYDLPSSLSVSRSDLIFIGDSVRVTTCRKDGTPFPQKNSFESSYPCGTMVDDEAEKVYIVDTDTHCVMQFKLDGTFIRKWGHGQLLYPIGIAKAGKDKLYVVDTLNSRIVVINVHTCRPAKGKTAPHIPE